MEVFGLMEDPKVEMEPTGLVGVQIVAENFVENVEAHHIEDIMDIVIEV